MATLTAAQRFLAIVAGVRTEVPASGVGGSANAYAIPCLGSGGALDPTHVPAGAFAQFKNLQRISDASYSILTTDYYVALTKLTAARVLTLPAASLYTSGQPLFTADESGSCSTTLTITVQTSGSDTIITGGLIGGSAITAVNLTQPGQKLAWHTNGTNGWTYG